jgi:GxxExxY protein
MNTDKSELIDASLTEKVIGVFFSVHKELGHGFSETVYESAFVVALRAVGLEVDQQERLQGRFRGVIVGEFIADLIVERWLLIEVKAVAQIVQAHEAQLTNYLKATGIRVGLVLNFGPRGQFRRRIFDPVLSV